jgi:hypothetical protein
MKIKEIQKQERKSKIISVRTLPSYCKWMNENKISPSKLFNLAIEELMIK